MDVHQIITDEDLDPQIIRAPTGEHSAKPEEVRSRIERLYVGPYLELYARQATLGWTCWGNELAAVQAAEPAPAPEPPAAPETPPATDAGGAQ